jgi:hypothetical protein
MNKKGAVELSMTTIIIIVIGITILSLGLVWIRSVFTDVGDLSSSAFEQGETQISEIFSGSDEALALTPSEMTIEQGESDTADLVINNREGDEVTISAEIAVKSLGDGSEDDITCIFTDSAEMESNSYTLGSGEGVSGLKVYVEDKSAAVGATYSCVITVDNLGSAGEQATLVINVE